MGDGYISGGNMKEVMKGYRRFAHPQWWQSHLVLIQSISGQSRAHYRCAMGLDGVGREDRTPAPHFCDLHD